MTVKAPKVTRKGLARALVAYLETFLRGRTVRTPAPAIRAGELVFIAGEIAIFHETSPADPTRWRVHFPLANEDQDLSKGAWAAFDRVPYPFHAPMLELASTLGTMPLAERAVFVADHASLGTLFDEQEVTIEPMDALAGDLIWMAPEGHVDLGDYFEIMSIHPVDSEIVSMRVCAVDNGFSRTGDMLEVELYWRAKVQVLRRARDW